MTPPPPLLGLLVTLAAALPAAAADLQPFRMPWNDASEGITNLQAWQPRPAGAEGRVTLSSDGHYAIAGQRTRFLGVDIVAASAFPSHANAEAHAARLARFGFNAVRLHQLEAPYDKPNALIDYSAGTSRTFSADRLERLQYFFAQLAAHGIYADVNLLVYREFQPADGLGAEISQMTWPEQAALGFFNDTALALHKEYATQLLTAPNPYRGGLSFAQDPAVAFVEVMNENGLLQQWLGGTLDTMPAIYRAQLQARWNQWLATRYASNSAMLAQWGAIDQPLGANRLNNGDFSAGSSGWYLGQQTPAAAAFAVTHDFNDQPSMRIAVTNAGSTNWQVALAQGSYAVEAGAVYTVSFWAKADRAVPLHAEMSRAYGDYAPIGASFNGTLDTTWRQYSFSGQAGATDTNTRVALQGFGDRLCTVWLADVRFQTGGKFGGLPEGTSLESATVPTLLQLNASTTYSLARRRDWTEFLLSLESTYWTAMSRHVKETLGFRGIVWGSVVATSTPNAQAVFDAMDSHAYWQHPTWPAGHDWDTELWSVSNVSMVNDPTGGVLGGIAQQRVHGRPHNVTEYQHPSPNTYGTEGPLLAAAYGALQDWDSLWLFNYATTTTEFVTGYFDHGAHPGKMANNLLAAALFRRGDAAPATNEFCMALPPEKEIDVATASGQAWHVADGAQLGVPAALSLASRLSLAIGPGATGLTTPPAPPAGPAIASDSGELLWDNSRANKGAVTINTSRTKAVVGFTDARSWNLGGVCIAPGPTRQDWSTIGITLLDGAAFGSTAAGRALIVATGDFENTNQLWNDATRSSVGLNWGTAPTRIEVVPATITLPVAASRVSAWALDGSGQRSVALAVTVPSPGTAQLTLGASGTTVWYEVAIASANSPYANWRETHFSGASANPAKEATIWGNNADPDGDGIPNLLEYALGLDPLRPNLAGLPQIAAMTNPADGQNYLTMTYSLPAAVSDVTVIPEISSDLTTWRSGAGALEVVGDTTAAGVRTIIVRDIQPLTQVQKHFMRLHVTTP